MRTLLMALAAAGLAACTVSEKSDNQAAGSTHARPSQAESEAYIRKAEEQWAMLGITKDRALLPRILAEDYVGMSPRGDLRDKAETIRNQFDPAKGNDAVSVHVDSVRYTHFGDTVVTQGLETFKHANGKPDSRIMWTDVWMWRDGQWQVVAGQAAVPIAAAPAAPGGDALTMQPTQNGLIE